MNKITHVSILVEDQLKALAFYTQVLGLQERTNAPMGEQARWMTVGPKGQPEIQIILQPVAWGTDSQSPAERSRLIGKNQGFVFETQDVMGEYNRLRAQGVRFKGAPGLYPWGKQVAFEDLYGNVHLLSERPSASAS